MAHFVRERTDEQYYVGLALPPVVLRNIDEKTKKAVAESGGTWAPSSTIVIGGAGLELQCGLQLTTSGTVDVDAPAYCHPTQYVANYRFGDDDYFKFETPHQRKITVSALTLSPYLRTLQRSGRLAAYVDTTVIGIQSRRPGAFYRVPLRIPDGARLEKVDPRFIVPTEGDALPEFYPRARVVRLAADGTITPYPGQTGTNNDVDGWVIHPDVGSTFAWQSGTNVKLTFPSLLFNALTGERADTSRYDYALEWIEEHGEGARAGNILATLDVTVRLPDLRPY